MRNGYMFDVLTSVDIPEVVKIGGKLIEVYWSVIYRKSEVSPYRKVIEKLFALGQKHKDEGNDLLQT